MNINITNLMQMQIESLNKEELQLKKRLNNISKEKDEINIIIKKQSNLDKFKGKRYFFIDSENMNQINESSKYNFNKEDEIYFFHCNDISKNFLSFIFSLNSKIIYIPISTKVQNGMDLIILSKIRECIKQKKKGSFILISKDNGYNVSLQMIKNDNIDEDIVIAKSYDYDMLNIDFFETKINNDLKEFHLNSMVEKITPLNIKKLNIDEYIYNSLYDLAKSEKTSKDMLFLFKKKKPFEKLRKNQYYRDLNIDKKKEIDILLLYYVYFGKKNGGIPYGKIKDIESFYEIFNFFYKNFGYNQDILFKILSKYFKLNNFNDFQQFIKENEQLQKFYNLEIEKELNIIFNKKEAL